MPGSFNGIGTMYYGNREQGPDGSYITTEWFTIFWIPLVPISSYRVLENEDDSAEYIIYSRQGYSIQDVPLNKKQVLNVYLVALPFILGFIWLLYRGLS